MHKLDGQMLDYRTWHCAWGLGVRLLSFCCVNLVGGVGALRLHRPAGCTGCMCPCTAWLCARVEASHLLTFLFLNVLQAFQGRDGVRWSGAHHAALLLVSIHKQGDSSSLQ